MQEADRKIWMTMIDRAGRHNVSRTLSIGPHPPVSPRAQDMSRSLSDSCLSAFLMKKSSAPSSPEHSIVSRETAAPGGAPVAATAQPYMHEPQTHLLFRFLLFCLSDLPNEKSGA